jgi:5-methylcytosine-specific restriction endonuclease McrA
LARREPTLLDRAKDAARTRANYAKIKADPVRYAQRKAKVAAWRARNKEAWDAYSAAYREKNAKKIAARRRQNYLKNRDKELKQVKEWQQENRERFLATNHEYKQKNADLLRQKGRERYWKNPKAAVSASRDWAKSHPERRALLERKRKVRKLNNGGEHTVEDIKKIYTMQTGKCAYCKIRLGKTYCVDHIMPLKLGGGNARANLQILCNSCNCKKSALHPLDYANRIGLLL